MEEFSRSRYRLESRYEHVLVDEFQDTSRAQWQLVRELVRAWAAGEGLAHGPIPPSIFIVGDRKQSIYGFRDAEVTVLDAAARYIDALRPESPARAAITRSYRSVHQLLSFVNDVCGAIEKQPERPDAFRYGEDDAFPMLTTAASEPEALGVVTAEDDETQAEMVADEIARLLIDGAVVRDRQTGVRRPITPGDIAVLFRTRESHALFEAALGRRGVPFYVYKGLGFFDAAEVKDVLALVGYLADPASDLRAAAWLRSRFVRLSDEALKVLAPRLADALISADAPLSALDLRDDDRERLELARASAGRWIALADQLPPAELVDRVLAESAYAAEIAGPGFAQARENLKKVRGLVRRIQNRGYATLGRLVDYFAELVAGGDESNAIIDAANAVNLMTVHAAKGLEFPVVFVVSIGKGSGGGRPDIRIVAPPFVEDEEALDTDPGSVAVGEHLSDADRDVDAKEHEESKRLLYVALTRARDRLYLGATVSGGRVSMGKGSLGRILPASLTAAMAVAADPAVAAWQGEHGLHALRRVPPAGEAPREWRPVVSVRDRTDDFEPMAATGAARVAVTEVVGDDASRVLAIEGLAATGGVDARVGSIVHLVLQRVLSQPVVDAESIAREVRRSDASGSDAASDVQRLCEAMALQPGLRAVLATGTPLFEVPFSIAGADGRVIRGSIDCLVAGPERVTVVEFKTGARLPEHQRQLEAYVGAARALFDGREVDGMLVYGGR